MVFHYQAWGSNGVMLRVWREASQKHKALWVITEDQGEEWREGRIILPSYDMEYRVRGHGAPGKVLGAGVEPGSISSILIAAVQSQGPFIIRECG